MHPNPIYRRTPDDVRPRAADEMVQSGIGIETDALAGLMRSPPNDD